MSKNVCMVMYGGPFDIVSHRIQQRLKILATISSSVYVIIEGMPKLGDIPPNVIIYDISANTKKIARSLFFKKIYSYIYSIFMLVRLSKNIDIVIFVTGFPKILFLILQAKLFQKKIISFAGGTSYKVFSVRHPNSKVVAKLVYILESLCFFFSDLILAETESSVRFLNLHKYKSKVFTMRSLMYLDDNFLRRYKKTSMRKNIIGYLGRLEPEKGIMVLVKAIPNLVKKVQDIEFVIYGSGSQRYQLIKYIKELNLTRQVKIKGWVPHEKVPVIFEQFKILVHPSLSEGLPLTVLEAMSRGTIVLVTPVGGLPDIVKEGETGFVLTEISPEDLANKIIEVLNLPPEEINRISKNAYVMVKEKHSLHKGIMRWKKVLQRM